jgi:hypothetical protein
MASIQGIAKTCARLAAIVMISALGGCAVYVDMNLKEVTPATKAVVANPKPVQMLFEFQTKGVRNGQATDMLKAQVQQIVHESGAFSDVSEAPVPSGALLNIVLNNIPLSNDAEAKGVITGATFGLVGNVVGDGYICTVDYIAVPNAPKITKTTKDAVFASIGLVGGGPPPNVQKMGGIEEAVRLMVRKSVGNAVNDVAKDPAFAGSTP